MDKTETENKRFRDEDLNKVSPSFCLAKWLQVTMHLHSGYNHSCHHPLPHKTPIKELKLHPSALHNTCYKKDQRMKMKNGIRPPECNYCWNIENLGPQFLSDRTLKSSELWARPHLERISRVPANENVNPTYVEVSFSNVCNFRCSYCSADFSTRWRDDIKRQGSYSTFSGEQTMEILEEENNPYIKAFWEWWPEMSSDLKVFRITGGEPLLSPNTFRVLEELIKNPRPDIELAVNSNLGISEAIFQKFLKSIKELTESSKVKSFRLFTSVDAFAEKAEYQRNGLEFPRFQKNIETFLREVPSASVTIMTTFNALSLTSFLDLLAYVKELKERYSAPNSCALFIDISYLREPAHQTVQVLPESYLFYMHKICEYMMEHKAVDNGVGGFQYSEVAKAQRVLEWMKQPLPEEELKVLRRRFFQFFSEHDRRRGTSFLGAFPEMRDFWKACERAYFL